VQYQSARSFTQRFARASRSSPGTSFRRRPAHLGAASTTPLKALPRAREARRRAFRFLVPPQPDERVAMNADQQKIVQYLNEALATEHALVRVLQSQIAMTPRGDFRSGLEKHLGETRDHAQRVAERLEALGQGGNPIVAVIGAAESAIGQLLALTKTPFDLLRGSGGEEKVLKNARDACATEALEIATYTSIKRLAKRAGDIETEQLAASILADEEKMLKRLLREIPKLTDAVFRAEVKGDPSYDVATTGAGETVRAAGKATKSNAEKTAKAGKKAARNARKVPGVAQVEGQAKGAVASADDLAIARYDSLTADEIISKLGGLSQIDLAKVDSYERKRENRTTILSRITSLRGDEPWPGYDELKASEVQSVLAEGDDERAARVRAYERAHKGRASVIAATERDHSNA
jgi:ferritin-like metal-binding protein YciE